MKITDIQATILSFRNKEIVSSTSWNEMRRVLVQVETDEGINGVGEAFGALSQEAVVSLVEGGLKRIVVGEDPFNIEKLVHKMFQSSIYVGRTGITRHAIAGVEIALWDILGKAKGMPVYQLLGGAFRDRAKAYASLPRINEVDDVVKYAKHCVQKGFKAIKLHQRDLESIAAAREATDDEVEIMVDANCPWTRTEALAVARACEDYDIRWLEEPIQPADDYFGLAELRASVDIPIALGENESTLRGFKTIMDLGAVDVLQPSLTKIGGLLLGKKICALAEAYNVEVAPHSWTLPMGVFASLHLIVSSPSCTYIEVPPALEESPLSTSLRMDDGCVLLPKKPGLGYMLDEKKVTKHKIIP